MSYRLTIDDVNMLEDEGPDLPINRMVRVFADAFEQIDTAAHDDPAEVRRLQYQAVHDLAAHMGVHNGLYGEPTFVLTARDPASPAAMRRYAEMADDLGYSSVQIETANTVREAMHSWRRTQNKKLT